MRRSSSDTPGWSARYEIALIEIAASRPWEGIDHGRAPSTVSAAGYPPRDGLDLSIYRGTPCDCALSWDSSRASEAINHATRRGEVAKKLSGGDGQNCQRWGKLESVGELASWWG